MPENHDMLTPQRCCLMIVDPQERLMAAIHKADRVVRNTGLLFHCARALEIPVLATTQYRKGLGPFVPELEELLADVSVIDKTEPRPTSASSRLPWGPRRRVIDRGSPPTPCRRAKRETPGWR